MNVFLFGSYAKRVHLIDSDVDVVVASKAFEGMNYVDRVALVREKLPPEISLDIISLTPKEFERGSVLIREVSKHWVKIGKE
ncbi:hypothetical protein HRbin02_01609 [Candidatus Calditenuaceae archaeon HR02]|nr:hypothetical protein HRbin02_01609 [Candidatus Calditenuaceae archaeon HR02]